jgi:hypothetical protein
MKYLLILLILTACDPNTTNIMGQQVTPQPPKETPKQKYKLLTGEVVRCESVWCTGLAITSGCCQFSGCDTEPKTICPNNVMQID